MEFDLNPALEEIKKSKADLIAIQMPEGIKPKAVEFAEKIEKETNAKVLIWTGTCFGACDIPLSLKELGVKYLIHIGHNRMNY